MPSDGEWNPLCAFLHCVVIETSILLNHAGTPRLTRRSLQAAGRHGPGAPPGDLQPAGEESAGGGGGSDRRRGGRHNHHPRHLEGRSNNHIQQVGHCTAYHIDCLYSRWKLSAHF